MRKASLPHTLSYTIHEHATQTVCGIREDASNTRYARMQATQVAYASMGTTQATHEQATHVACKQHMWHTRAWEQQRASNTWSQSLSAIATQGARASVGPWPQSCSFGQAQTPLRARLRGSHYARDSEAATNPNTRAASGGHPGRAQKRAWWPGQAAHEQGRLLEDGSTSSAREPRRR